MCVDVYMYSCVYSEEASNQQLRDRQKEPWRERERKRECVCVCVCVYIYTYVFTRIVRGGTESTTEAAARMRVMACSLSATR